MTDSSGVNIEIREIPQIDTSDLNTNTLEESTYLDVSDNIILEADESGSEMQLMGMFPKKRSLKKSSARRQMRKHKTMLNALKKYKREKTEEESQPIDKVITVIMSIFLQQWTFWQVM